jgi:hypothetical protein
MPPLSNSAGEVAVRLGGEFALLSESENRHRTLLLQAEALVNQAETALEAERTKTAKLQVAMQLTEQAAGEAGAAAAAAQLELRVLERKSFAASVASSALHEEVLELECSQAALAADAEDLASLLARTALELEEERQHTAALTCKLADRDAALELAAAREAQLRRDLDDEKQRSRRFAQARTEKEKQLAVVMSEKNRLSALLSKKDNLARDLSSALKSHERQQDQRQQQEQTQRQQRRVVRAQAAIAMGEAAAEAALASPDPTTARHAGAKKGAMAPPAHAGPGTPSAVTPASFVPPRVPGVQSRFEGWRTASAKERDAALRTENAVLIGVLAERDAALHTADTEMRKLRAEHDAMRTKWREAMKAQRRWAGLTGQVEAAPPVRGKLQAKEVVEVVVAADQGEMAELPSTPPTLATPVVVHSSVQSKPRPQTAPSGEGLARGSPSVGGINGASPLTTSSPPAPPARGRGLQTPTRESPA